jgi:hypothetical protein
MFYFRLTELKMAKKQKEKLSENQKIIVPSIFLADIILFLISQNLPQNLFILAKKIELFSTVLFILVILLWAIMIFNSLKKKKQHNKKS